jgi:nicotinate-nucleotide--dimethylbenzimidazole phosphoribosyltransferase
VPVLLDGYISTSAALAAVALEPRAVDWMLASHRSAELGHRVALEWLKLEPLLDLGMRLGEGTGAALTLPLVRAALALHAEMATFAEAGVSEG